MRRFVRGQEGATIHQCPQRNLAVVLLSSSSEDDVIDTARPHATRVNGRNECVGWLLGDVATYDFERLGSVLLIYQGNPHIAAIDAAK